MVSEDKCVGNSEKGNVWVKDLRVSVVASIGETAFDAVGDNELSPTTEVSGKLILVLESE